MNRLLTIAFSLVLLAGCTEKPRSKSAIAAAKVKTDSDQKHVVASKAAKVASQDTSDDEPAFDEVKADLLSKYDKVERIDTTIIVGADTLNVHEKYYCLKDNAVIVPKRYLWGGDTTKDFVTHSFVTQITIVKNKHTIINKIFRKKDFDPIVNPEERKYAIIFTADFEGYRKKYNGVVFCYSITIPLTDVGVSACIAVDMNGHYQMLNDHTELD